MAFKFKVKKRPSQMQSAVAGFAGGFGRGFNVGKQTLLQNAIKTSNEAKEQSAKELNLFNTMVAGLPQTPNNRSKILNGRIAIMSGKTTAASVVNALDIDAIDYETVAEKKASEAATFEKESELTSLRDPQVAVAERKTRESAGMYGIGSPEVTTDRVLSPTEAADAGLSSAGPGHVWVRTKAGGLKRVGGTPATPPTEAQYWAWNISTKKHQRATKEEIERNISLDYAKDKPDPETRQILLVDGVHTYVDTGLPVFEHDRGEDKGQYVTVAMPDGSKRRRWASHKDLKTGVITSLPPAAQYESITVTKADGSKHRMRVPVDALMTGFQISPPEVTSVPAHLEAGARQEAGMIGLGETESTPDRVLSDTEVAEKGLLPPGEGFVYTISQTGDISRIGQKPPGEVKPPLTIDQRQIREAEKIVMVDASVVNMTVSEYLAANPDDPAVVLLRLLTGEKPDEGMRLPSSSLESTVPASTSDTKVPVIGESKRSFIEHFGDILIDTSSAVKAIHPTTGKTIYLKSGDWYGLVNNQWQKIQ